MYPVLIGSYALVEHNLIKTYHDIDLIVNNEIGGSLALKSDEKKHLMLFFDETKVDLHLTNTFSNQLIFEKCNQSLASVENPFNCRLIKLSFCDAILSPLELIYAIIKSHIYRIVPVTPYQDQNIDIWYRHLKHYNLIRNHLGYSRMDEILYDGYLGDWKKNHSDDKLEDLIRQVFQTRFRETMERIGDTPISMDKTKDDFFNDNVERHVDHDQLHAEIGLTFRNDSQPIFTKYQTDPTKVSLDRQVFLMSTQKERIEMIREELMVLLLERKWIPEVIHCYQDALIPYYHFDVEIKRREFYETGSNFITNLCGQGDYWLRRYCIDHADILLDSDLYDFDKLKSLTLKITGYESKCLAIRESDIIKKIHQYKGENLPYLKKIYENIHLHEVIPEEKTTTVFRFFDEPNDLQTDDLVVISFLELEQFDPGYDLCAEINTIIFGEKVNSGIYEMSKYFDGVYNVGIVNDNGDVFILYNIVNNVGLYVGESIHIFLLTMGEEKNKLVIHGSYVNIIGKEISEFTNEYIEKCKTYYYYSTDCDWSAGNSNTVKFLSSYGSMPSFMKPFVDKIVSIYYDLDISDTSSDSDN